VFDSTSITTATALTLVIRKDNGLINYTATTTLTPNTTATQFDFLVSAFNDTTGTIASIAFGKFTAFLTYSNSGSTTLVFCHVSGNANTLTAQFDTNYAANLGVA